MTKFEVAPMGRTSQLTFLIKVNNDQVFEKTLAELIRFCSELNQWAEGKNTNIEQLYMMVQDSFQVQSVAFPGSLTAADNIMHGLAGQASHNTSWNAEAHAEPMLDNKVPKNLEQTLFSLEDHFWYILNNPICYSEIIWRFFGKHSLFCMFPHVEAFFRTYRLTGNPHSALPIGGPNNIIKSPGSMP